MSGGNPFPAALAVDVVSGDPREQLGITLDGDTVLCEDCLFIGLPLNARCRKCVSHSLTRLAEVLHPEKVQEKTPPVHPFEIRISIGANDWGFAERVLSELANAAENEGDKMGNCCSGGYDGSFAVTIAKREISAEAYRDELSAWHERQKGEAHV